MEQEIEQKEISESEKSLFIAAEMNDVETIKALVKEGINYHARWSRAKNMTPFMVAMYSNSKEAAIWFITNKIDCLKDQGIDGVDGFAFAVLGGHLDTLEAIFLALEEKKINTKDLYKKCLLTAIHCTQLPIVEWLITNKKVDFYSAKTFEGTTALDIAKKQGILDKIEIFLQKQETRLTPTPTKNNYDLKLVDTEKKEINIPTQAKPTPSAVDDKFLITHDTWVVSIMRKASTGNTEHAFLMVEGINQFSKSIVRRYDLATHDSRNGYAQIVIRPLDDTQLEVKTVANWTKGDKCYYQSWAITRDQALQLQKNCLRDKDIANSPEGIRYFISGDQSLIGKSSLKQGHSCFTWAREKLIEIEDERKIFSKDLKSKITDCIVAKTSLYLPKPKKEKEKSIISLP